MRVQMPAVDPEAAPVGAAPRPSPDKASRAPAWLPRQSGQCLFVVALATASYFVVSHYFLQTVQVVGKSMVPTLNDAQHYLLNRWVFYFRTPQRGDVVVIRDPTDNGFSVKRIIAVAGDSIYLKDESVYLNGQRLYEPYLRPGTLTLTNSRFQNQLILCGKNQFFLLGDNRRYSVDSRTYGTISGRRILGLIVP